jgi:hypothetical protein
MDGTDQGRPAQIGLPRRVRMGDGLFRCFYVTLALVEGLSVWLALDDPSIGPPWALLPLAVVSAGLLAYAYVGFRQSGSKG